MTVYGQDATLVRDDFEVKTLCGKRIKTSFYYPEMSDESDKIQEYGFDELPKDCNNIPTLVYLHSQSGSRLEGIP